MGTDRSGATGDAEEGGWGVWGDGWSDVSVDHAAADTAWEPEEGEQALSVRGWCFGC